MKREQQLKTANARDWIWDKINTQLLADGFISAG
jgi:hypothetical protein